MKEIFALTAAVLLASFGFAYAGVTKVDVCHFTGSESNPFEIISIADAAFPAHEAHGDFELPQNESCEDDDGGGDPV